MFALILTFLLVQSLSAYSVEFPNLMTNLGQRIRIFWDKDDITKQVDFSLTHSDADGQVPSFRFCGPFPDSAKGKCTYEYDYPVISESSKLRKWGSGEFEVPSHKDYGNGHPCIYAKNDIPNFKAIYKTANEQQHINDYYYQYHATYSCFSEAVPSSSGSFFKILGVVVALVLAFFGYVMWRRGQKKISDQSAYGSIGESQMGAIKNPLDQNA